MKRKNLFLFHEQSWMPAIIRKSIAAYLQFVASAKATDEELEEIRDRNSGLYNKDSFLAMQPDADSEPLFELDTADLSEARLTRLLTDMAWQRQSFRITDIKQAGSIVLPEILLTPFKALLFSLVPATFSFRNIFFSWVIPVVPLAAIWDTLAGHLRRYSEDELREIIEHIHVPGYSFQLVRTNDNGNSRFNYLIGSSEYQKAA